MTDSGSADNVFSINSGRPFHQSAFDYLERGFSPLPLPEKKKFPPPTGYTGKSAKEPDARQISEWNDASVHPEYAKGNVGLHLSFVRPSAEISAAAMPEGPAGGDGLGWFDEQLEPRYVIIGIDIDEYDDKHGWDTYQRAVKGVSAGDGSGSSGDWPALGELPDTWVSSARENGKAGIRYFLAPAGLSYKGGLGSIQDGRVKEYGTSVDVIQRAHRFAVVWPSAHPDAGQYQWYAPGVAPDGVSGAGKVPCAWEFPVLPEPWIKYLSRDYVPFTVEPIDMDVSLDDLQLWAKKTAAQNGGPRKISKDFDKASEVFGGVSCSLMRKRVAARINEVMGSDDSHNPLIWMHWEFYRAGILNGHAGWQTAISMVESVWIRHVLGDAEAQADGVESSSKRSLEECRAELFRSRSMALRKIKKEVADMAEEGSNIVGLACACYEEPPLNEADDADGLNEALSLGALDPGEYEMNDDGNGQHFCDLYQDRFRFVLGYDKWIFWTGKRWEWAENGLDRRAFRRVKVRQQAYATTLLAAALEAKATDQDDAKQLMERARAWKAWSDRSGNNAQAKNALEAAQENQGISLPADEFDSKIRLLGVENGVLELGDEGVVFRQATMEDMVVTNTGVPYCSLDDILSGRAGAEALEGVRLWEQFLDLFQPELEKRLWLQQMLGMCLIAGNPAKKFVFLHGEPHTGKSTILNLVMAALGDYAGSAEMSIFKGKELNPALAQALPWRVLTTTEAGGNAGSFGSGSGGGLDGEMLKRLTGNDPMSAELKGVNTIIRRKPAFVPVVATNNAPHVDGLDAGLRERIEAVPFDVVQAPMDAPVGIEDRMVEIALPAILAWLVEGWKMYATHRLCNRPAELQAVAAKFEREMSGDIGTFMEDCLEIGLGRDVAERTEAVYQAYKGWAKHQNIQDNKVWDKNMFGRRMSKAGYKSMGKRNEAGRMERHYVGLKLRDDLKSVLSFKIHKED